jgi:glycogen phosphorylase
VQRARSGGYRPADHYHGNGELRAALDLLASGLFSHGDRDLFRPLVDGLLKRDEYLALADFAAYAECQQAVGDCYRDTRRWTRMSILNVARIGRFSSDRAIREYCRDIWRVEPVAVKME